MKKISKFYQQEDGNLTVEYAIWFPFTLALIGLIAEMSISMAVMSTMTDVSRDAARRVAVGELSAQEGEEYALSYLSPSTSPEVQFQIVDDRDVRVSISADPGFVILRGMDFLNLGRVEVSYVMRKEGVTLVGS